MAGAFHWVKVRLFCYSTEDHGILKETMSAIAGADGFREEHTEGHHGNPITILDSDMTRDRDIRRVFTNLGKPLTDDVLNELEDRIDEDCVFHLRLDKQKAVHGEYTVAHHGDVVSVTAKIVSHPAKKAIAVESMRTFLGSLF